MHDNRYLAGVGFGLLAYVIWGFFPLYFRQLSHVSPMDVLSHRAVAEPERADRHPAAHAFRPRDAIRFEVGDDATPGHRLTATPEAGLYLIEKQQ